MKGRIYTPVGSAARTADSNSGTLTAAEDTSAINVFADVTVVSGTDPTIDFTVEWSPDSGTTWFLSDPADAMTQIVAAGKAVKRFTPKAGTYRVAWVIGGTVTPTFTFSLTIYEEQAIV